MVSFISEGNCFRPGIAPSTSGMKLLSSTTATLTLLHQLALMTGATQICTTLQQSYEHFDAYRFCCRLYRFATKRRTRYNTAPNLCKKDAPDAFLRRKASHTHNSLQNGASAILKTVSYSARCGEANHISHHRVWFSKSFQLS
ncbi:hypothetical protein Y032_0157g3188 [Ancylostoma ceylanicum]|uniref:Uncharacterized protein n=1 Tax=Ancylostoma ceylanicum TaxID=53326 RepID=A0A016SZA5_9BILA|nr:hypothetical protein Y032_0157g3188 [Ancylostoma ceylanicum]